MTTLQSQLQQDQAKAQADANSRAAGRTPCDVCGRPAEVMVEGPCFSSFRCPSCAQAAAVTFAARNERFHIVQLASAMAAAVTR